MLGGFPQNSQLFGADDEADGQDLDDAEKNGENGQSHPVVPVGLSTDVLNVQPTRFKS